MSKMKSRLALSGIVSLLVSQSAFSAIKIDTLRLNLQECISRAKRDGVAARALRFEFASQQAEYSASRAEYLPHVSLEASLPGYSRAIVPVLQPDGTYLNLEQAQMYSAASLNLSQKIPFSGGEVSLSSELNNRSNLVGLREQNWNATPFSINLRQPVNGFNAYSYEMRIAELRMEQHRRAFIEQMEGLATQAATRFFDYYIASMNEENALKNIELNDSIHVLAKGRYNVGKIAENDLLQNELAVLSARNEFQRAVRTRERSLAALQLVVGVPTETYIIVSTPPPAITVDLDVLRVAELALQHRSETPLYEVEETIAERSLHQAKVNNRFNATLSASYGLNQSASTIGSAYRTLLEQDRFSFNVELPLLNWGRSSSLVESATADYQRNRWNNMYRLQQLRQSIEFDLRDFLQLADLLTVADRSQTIAARRYEVARNRYIIGKIETTELMLAQREKDEARRGYFAALRDYWVSYYALRQNTLYDVQLQRSIELRDEE